MTRREQIKIYLGMIKGDAPQMDPETIRVGIELMWEEIRALWAVVDALEMEAPHKELLPGELHYKEHPGPLYVAVDEYRRGQS